MRVAAGEHQKVLKGRTRGEVIDMLNEFFVEHGDNIRVLNVLFGPDECKVLFEWSIHTTKDRAFSYKDFNWEKQN